MKNVRSMKNMFYLEDHKNGAWNQWFKNNIFLFFYCNIIYTYELSTLTIMNTKTSYIFQHFSQ